MSMFQNLFDGCCHQPARKSFTKPRRTSNNTWRSCGAFMSASHLSALNSIRQIGNDAVESEMSTTMYEILLRVHTRLDRQTRRAWFVASGAARCHRGFCDAQRSADSKLV